MSTVYQNGKRWYYQIYLPGPDGKQVRVQKSLGTTDKKIAVKKAKDLDDKYLRQQIKLISKVRVDQKIEEYLEYRRSRAESGQITKNTYRSDVGSLKRFAEFLKKSKVENFNDFDDRDKATDILERYMASRRADGIGSNTIRRDLRHTSGFFAYFVASPRRLLSKNPVSDVTLPKPIKRTNAPSQDSWLKLREYLRNQAKDDSLTRAEEIIWFQIETGCRIGEVLRLKWQRSSTDLIGSGESWSALEERCKQLRLYSKRRERVVPIEPINGGALMKHLRKKEREHPFEFVFGSPVTGQPLNLSQFGRAFRKVLQNAGLDATFSSHGIRHGYISFLINQGISSDQIGWLVGHSASEITAIYSHVDQASLANVVRALG